MVYVDKDGGIGVGDLKMISRHIENELDRETEDFSLEVSSPGLFNPFKIHRQYINNVGKTVEVQLKDGHKHSGVMSRVDDNGIQLEVTKKVPKEKGKGKVTITEQLEFTFEEIAQTKIEFKF